MRKFLYSRWFFGMLALVLGFDFATDFFQAVTPGDQPVLDYLALVFDGIGMAMALWMFLDLSKRRPRRGDHTSGRR